MSQKIERTLIFRITLFLAASVVTVLTIPSETVFRYEVRQGSPWAYPDLIASSDFPIAKSEARLQREKDSLIADMKPYYTYDSTVFENTMTLLQNTLQSAELKMIEKQASETGKPLKQAQAMRDSFAFFKKELTLVITENAQKNVLENLPPDKKIIILHGKLATEKLTENCLSEKDFYNKMKGFESRFASEIYPKLNYLLFVAPNTMPDPDTYETVKEERLSSLSLNSGMIQSGERIIAKGELISESKQRILYSYRQFLEEDADLPRIKHTHFWANGLCFYSFMPYFLCRFIFLKKELSNR